MEGNIFIRKLFGGETKFIIYDADYNFALDLVDEVYEEAIRLQKIFNFYDEKSELSLLNKIRKMRVSGELLEVIKFAIDLSEKTSGSYDVSLGKYILSRKSGEKFDIKCSYKDIMINGNFVELTNSEVQIDLGSIAKGYITDRLADKFEELGINEFLIDSRGDIIVRGNRVHILGIENPRGNGNLGFVKLKNVAIATSGDYKQFSGDFFKSHILNQKDSMLASVICEKLFEADSYATAIFTMEENKQEELLDKMDCKVLIFCGPHNLKMFNGFELLEDFNEN